ncbi:MAG TPA: hypothetical protein DEP05_09380 [Betaproteobacteria bacterium]|nr:hypothetical protein [Betaproteobacteria bacterium]
MAIGIKLNDKQLPLSPVFLEFLNDFLQQKQIEATWHDQLSEELVFRRDEILKNAQEASKFVLEQEYGRRAIIHVYELLVAIITGRVSQLRPYHERYRFFCIVGAPRHGGSYLTKQLFRAVDINPEVVPDVLAHDGFPEAAPFTLVPHVNTHLLLMHNLAEYLTMVDMFFANETPRDGQIIVPKKATKLAYHAAVFNRLFGPRTEYIITLRHPVAACISTYEKSGGFPSDGKYKMRSKIEEWIRRDNAFNGMDSKSILRRDYFDVYLRYWELYHYNLALTGLPHCRNLQIIAYGKERMTALAQSFFDRFSNSGRIEAFHVFDKKNRHREWLPKAEAALRRVQGVWETAGLPFPLDEIMEAW